MLSIKDRSRSIESALKKTGLLPILVSIYIWWYRTKERVQYRVAINAWTRNNKRAVTNSVRGPPSPSRLGVTVHRVTNNGELPCRGCLRAWHRPEGYFDPANSMPCCVILIYTAVEVKEEV